MCCKCVCDSIAFLILGISELFCFNLLFNRFGILPFSVLFKRSEVSFLKKSQVNGQKKDEMQLVQGNWLTQI